jgi:hypothetical protein
MSGEGVTSESAILVMREGAWEGWPRRFLEISPLLVQPMVKNETDVFAISWGACERRDARIRRSASGGWAGCSTFGRRRDAATKVGQFHFITARMTHV